MAVKRLAFKVFGSVQGVGYRYFVLDTARELGISGWTSNRPDGSVEGEAEGEDASLDEFIRSIEAGPPDSCVEKIATEVLAPSKTKTNLDGKFEIRI